jgi:hypothetical protein
VVMGSSYYIYKDLGQDIDGVNNPITNVCL